MSFDPAKTVSVHHSRLTIIKSLLEGYDGSVPFHLYLKSCFVKHKNFGSRDRKIYSSWCFAFYRLGNAIPDHDFNVRLAVAWYLVHGPDNDIFKTLNEGRLSDENSGSIADRIKHVAEVFPDFRLTDIFSFTAALSDDISVTDYAASMLVQPRVWIRIAQGKEKSVIDDLEANGISFEKDKELPLCYSFDPGVKLDALVSKQKGYFEIQDHSSQKAGATIPAKSGEHWWDCCCGAGGKALEVFDKVPGVKITATDSRASILKNFRERTQQFHTQLSTTVLDLEQPVSASFFGSKFDGIIADVPCSGSGTWSRSPENLRYFNEGALTDYVERQKKIVSSAIPFLKPNGSLVYITCSVFTCENEEMVEWVTSIDGMKVSESGFINGSSALSDSMFYAIFSKD